MAPVAVKETVSSIIGKNTIITVVALGNNTNYIYINGVLHSTITNPSDFVFNSILKGYDSTVIFKGKWHFHKIQNGALTAGEVAEEHAMLRGIYPEVESVIIRTQTWATSNFEAVATPQGNVIQEMQANAAVEKITNAADREFSIDTGWWTMREGWSISGGFLNAVSTSLTTLRLNLLTINKWYKITVDINCISGSVVFQTGSYLPGISNTGSIITSGSKTFYLRCHSTTPFTIEGIGFTGTIDNISVQELNWSNSTEIYDAVYAATSGDAATKEYAALKEAAMWCYYNNSADNGAIYGKLYNWYAAKLLQMDFILANFGYLISSDSDNIITDADASKIIGTKYWSDANGTNSNGLSLIGAGYRDLEGNFIGLKNICILWNADDNISNDEKRYGFAVRIIKSV